MASIAKRPDGQWRARYRGPDGSEHSKHFGRRVDAQRWLDQERPPSSRPAHGLRRVPPRSPSRNGAPGGWPGTAPGNRPPCEWRRCTSPRSLNSSVVVGWTRCDLPISRAGWCSCRLSTRLAMSTRYTPGWPRRSPMPSTMECWPATRALVVRRRVPALSGLTWPPRSRSGRSTMRWGSGTERACCWHPLLA
jgi:hypothetical protein